MTIIRKLRAPERAIAGISGGRTSAMMAYDLPQHVVLTFQNTGEEHERTLEFLCELEDDLQRPILRLEFRAPPRGEPPKAATFEILTHRQLARDGEPFRDFLEMCASYRAEVKGKPPIAPWAASRICTSFLKIKVQNRYCRSLGWDDWTSYVGYRFDEPDRVAMMRERNDKRDTDERAPLYDARVTKSDVMDFWSKKRFDLGLPEHLGNCKACFMKDERDLADSFRDPSTHPERWIAIEREFGPMRRGGRPSYAQVLDELPERLRIREQVIAGVSVDRIESSLPTRRVHLIVKQEMKPREEWSCGCASASLVDDEFILEAP